MEGATGPGSDQAGTSERAKRAAPDPEYAEPRTVEPAHSTSTPPAPENMSPPEDGVPPLDAASLVDAERDLGWLGVLLCVLSAVVMVAVVVTVVLLANTGG